MENFFTKITKQKEDRWLYEEGILKDSGRLSDEGLRLVVDLLFQGNDIKDVKKMIISSIKEEKEENK